MSGNNLTLDVQFRYICQWFNEWSELQREDFVPILIDYCLKAGHKVYMNGVVNELGNSGCNLKPLSLFQCRIKLFKDWIPNWTEDMKVKLKEKITEIDPKIGEKVNEELATLTNGSNGIHESENQNNTGNFNNDTVRHQLQERDQQQQQQPEENNAEQMSDNDDKIDNNLEIINDQVENVAEQDRVVVAEPVVESNQEN